MRELRSWRRVKLSLVRERSQAPYGLPPAIRCGADVATMLRVMLSEEPRECFVAVYLDARHRMLAVHVCSLGTADSSQVHPREVFGPALTLSASAMVVAHNHPSGDATPSPDDRRVTERLREAGELLGVTMLDHVIIGERRFWSFSDECYSPF